MPFDITAQRPTTQLLQVHLKTGKVLERKGCDVYDSSAY